MQGYRPSQVPQDLIEQIAVVVEAKAFLHVVSNDVAAQGRGTAQALWLTCGAAPCSSWSVPMSCVVAVLELTALPAAHPCMLLVTYC